MLFRRTMVQEVLRTFEQGENRYTCCRRTVLSGEKGTKIGYRQGGGKGGGGRGRSKLGTAGPLFAFFPTKTLILFAALIHATIFFSHNLFQVYNKGGTRSVPPVPFRFVPFRSVSAVPYPFRGVEGIY